MTSTAAVLAAVAVLALLYRFLVYPVFLSPLSDIPSAHWSASLSPLWILAARRHGRENRALLAAHRRLGPVVRVAPGTLSVDGLDGLKTIYRGGFEKSAWYGQFDNYDTPNMFTTLGAREHSARKRLVSHVYSKSHIQTSPAARAQTRAILSGRLLPLLARSAAADQAPHGIDVHATFLATTMDLLAAYVFGLANGTNFIEQTGFRGHWLELYLSRVRHQFWPQEMPRLTAWCKAFGLRLCPAWVDGANRELADWALGLCRRTTLAVFGDGSGKKATTQKPEDEPVVFNALHAGLEREVHDHGAGSVLYPTALQRKDLAVASELFDHVTAGQETSGIALTYLSWHLSRRPALQDQLRAELLTLDAPLIFDSKRGGLPASLPDPKHLDALPLLHAVLTETLRLHAPIPGPQPRQTPASGCRIDGYYVPGGVRVACLAYTLHRDERVFPHPETWDHSRWMPGEADETGLRERGRWFWAFGSGGRMCLGSNFAMNEMKHIIAAIYTNFTTHIVDDEGMEQLDHYTARPASDRLFLRFERVAT